MAFDIEPKFISFDLHGTLIQWHSREVVRDSLGDRIPPDIFDDFVAYYESVRFDEVLGDWKPYHEVIENGTRRSMLHFDLEYRPGDGRAFYEGIGSWGPYDDVPPVLRRLAEKYPLVIITNSDEAQVYGNVERLDAPIHATITAEQAKAYKPRFQAFEYMLDKLDVDPSEIVHVSASPMYDLRSAKDLGITHTVYMDRGWEPHHPWLGYERITNIAELPGLVGL